MGMSVVKVASGGLPVTIAASGGFPCTEAANGHGIAVMQSTTGGGLAVTGFAFGPDVTAPTITSSNSVSNPENSVLAHILTANEAVTWSIIGGTDAARFELSGNALRWLGNGIKDFEAPNDSDLNNTYVVQIRAVDPSSNGTNQTITVTVTNVTSGSMPAPVAPALTLTSATTDLTPDFTLTGDLVLNDTVRFQYSTASDFTGAAELTNTIDAGEDAANSINFTTGTLAVNTWYFRARVERPEYTFSDWSNVVTVTLTSSGTSAEVAQFLARSSSLDGTHTAAYTALIDGLVADGIWPKIDALYIFATQSTANALLNLKSSSYVATVTGTPAFVADDGYTGNTGDYLNTALNASLGGVNYTQNSAHMSVWVFSDDGSLGMGSVIGTLSGSAHQYIFPNYQMTSTAYFRLNQNIPPDLSVAVANGAGFSLANRSSVTDVQGYKNGASIVTGSSHTSVTLNNSVFTFPDQSQGLDADSSHRLCGGSFGSSLTSTEVGNFYTRMRAYMTAVGVP